MRYIAVWHKHSPCPVTLCINVLRPTIRIDQQHYRYQGPLQPFDVVQIITATRYNSHPPPLGGIWITYHPDCAPFFFPPHLVSPRWGGGDKSASWDLLRGHRGQCGSQAPIEAHRSPKKKKKAWRNSRGREKKRRGKRTMKRRRVKDGRKIVGPQQLVNHERPRLDFFFIFFFPSRGVCKCANKPI